MRQLIIKDDTINVQINIDLEATWPEIMQHFIGALRLLGYNMDELEETLGELYV